MFGRRDSIPLFLCQLARVHNFNILPLNPNQWSGPWVIKLFQCSSQPSTKFILLINVKMPSIVGILTFISMIITTSERLKAINFVLN